MRACSVSMTEKKAFLGMAKEMNGVDFITWEC